MKMKNGNSLKSRECSYRRTVLPNGIRVITERMDSVRSVTTGVWIMAGTRKETEKNNGLFHLLEHMIFKGTETRSAYDIAVSLETLGGQLNGFTEKEMTCFYAVVLDHHLKKSVEILADIVQNPSLNESDLFKEKQIVCEEIANLEDTPEDLVQEFFVQHVFGHHPLGLPILGSRESIDGLTPKDLRHTHETWYTPDRIIITAAGHVDHDYFVQLVEEYFDGNPYIRTENTETVHTSPHLSKIFYTETSQSHVCVGYPICAFQDRQKYPMIMLNILLGSGMSSRLFQRLREDEGLAYAVYSCLDFWSDTGVWNLYAGTSPGQTSCILDIFDAEINRLMREGIAEQDLNNIKSQLAGNMVLNLEDSTNRMNRLAKFEAYTETYLPPDETIQYIRSMTVDDLMKTVNLFFSENRKYITMLEPLSMKRQVS